MYPHRRKTICVHFLQLSFWRQEQPCPSHYHSFFATECLANSTVHTKSSHSYLCNYFNFRISDNLFNGELTLKILIIVIMVNFWFICVKNTVHTTPVHEIIVSYDLRLVGSLRISNVVYIKCNYNYFMFV